MKPSDLFGVFVRATGFLIASYGLWEIFGGLENIAENLLSAGQDEENQQTSSLAYFVFGAAELIFGVICFFLADWVVRLAYGKPAD